MRDGERNLWVQRFAYWPVRTHDAGWLWLQPYWRFRRLRIGLWLDIPFKTKGALE